MLSGPEFEAGADWLRDVWALMVFIGAFWALGWLMWELRHDIAQLGVAPPRRDPPAPRKRPVAPVARRRWPDAFPPDDVQ